MATCALELKVGGTDENRARGLRAATGLQAGCGACYFARVAPPARARMLRDSFSSSPTSLSSLSLSISSALIGRCFLRLFFCAAACAAALRSFSSSFFCSAYAAFAAVAVRFASAAFVFSSFSTSASDAVKYNFERRRLNCTNEKPLLDSCSATACDRISAVVLVRKDSRTVQTRPPRARALKEKDEETNCPKKIFKKRLAQQRSQGSARETAPDGHFWGVCDVGHAWQEVKDTCHR
eukprot:2056832-Pleurochrysis_carterae.AAC.2